VKSYRGSGDAALLLSIWRQSVSRIDCRSRGLSASETKNLIGTIPGRALRGLVIGCGAGSSMTSLSIEARRLTEVWPPRPEAARRHACLPEHLRFEFGALRQSPSPERPPPHAHERDKSAWIKGVGLYRTGTAVHVQGPHPSLSDPVLCPVETAPIQCPIRVSNILTGLHPG
jgi:hypothetical protein